MTDELIAPTEELGEEQPIENQRADNPPEHEPPPPKPPRPSSDKEGYYFRHWEKAQQEIKRLQREKQETEMAAEQKVGEVMSEINQVKAAMAETQRSLVRDKLILKSGLDPEEHGQFVFAQDEAGMKSQIEALLKLRGVAEPKIEQPTPQPDPEPDEAKPEAPQPTPGEDRPKPASEQAVDPRNLSPEERIKWAREQGRTP
jgi:hypothetical protein